MTFKLGNNIYRVYSVHENEAKSILKTTLFFEDEVKNAAKNFIKNALRGKIQNSYQTVQFSQWLINSIIISSLLVEYIMYIINRLFFMDNDKFLQCFNSMKPVHKEIIYR